MKRMAVFFADYLYDLGRFWKYSAFRRDIVRSPVHLQAQLMMSAHGIEKLLAFQHFDPARGGAKLAEARRLIKAHEALGLRGDDVALMMAKDALANYASRVSGLESAAELGTSPRLPYLESRSPDASVRANLRDVLDGAERAATLKGIRTRASIREYADRPVSMADVEAAVSVAMSAPSVCNRQGWRLHVTTERSVIDAALSHQNGNRGFGERVPGLAVITTTLSIFSDSSERNQAFVDGGLFSMNLMLALHAHGLGSCPLNWSTSYRQDRALRRAVTIPDDEAIVMMISFGWPDGDCRAPASRRYPLTKILRRLDVRAD